MFLLLALIPIIVVACFGKWLAALIVLGTAVLLDVLIALLRVGARATLEENVFSLTVIAGPVRLKLLPPKNKEEKAKKPKKEKKPKEAGEEKPKPKIKITLDLISTILSAVGELLGRLRRKLRVDKLTVHYTVATDDPYNTAMTFGYASAAVNALMPVIDNIFKVKDHDVGVDVAFDAPEPKIYVDAQLTIAIWEILYIVLAVWPPVKAILAQILNKGKVDNNGQASDQ